jgi:hypothetical protein
MLAVRGRGQQARPAPSPLSTPAQMGSPPPGLVLLPGPVPPVRPVRPPRPLLLPALLLPALLLPALLLPALLLPALAVPLAPPLALTRRVRGSQRAGRRM